MNDKGSRKLLQGDLAFSIDRHNDVANLIGRILAHYWLREMGERRTALSPRIGNGVTDNTDETKPRR
jgi:hypothetical protein